MQASYMYTHVAIHVPMCTYMHMLVHIHTCTYMYIWPTIETEEASVAEGLRPFSIFLDRPHRANSTTVATPSQGESSDSAPKGWLTQLNQETVQ